MNMQSIETIAATLMAPGKGILAADESTGTADKRFAARSIPQTEEMRRTWRELLFTAPHVEDHLSGVILYDETIRQSASNGVPFPKLLSDKGILPGIKVDKGTVPLPDSPQEKMTEGLDGLSDRLKEYAAMGAKFTKWRAVILIADGLPTDACLTKNAEILAQYARTVQYADMVPIIEPEVLLDGTHTLAQSEDVIRRTLIATFAAVNQAGVHLPGLILKSSMALPGKDSGIVATAEEVAEATIRAFTASIPKEVGGIVFLSGGQTAQEATERLNAMALMRDQYPWRLTFSYSRALQDPAMDAWMGKPENVDAAQAIFAQRVQETALASEGKYSIA